MSRRALGWADSGDGGWLAGARAARSPHRDARPAGAVVDLLVVHHISLPPGRFSGDAIERLFTGRLDPDAHPYFEQLRGMRVSAHFLIRRRGELLQFVGCDERAWHAGASAFLGRERCNDFSIGVELEGDGRTRFTEAQYRRLAALTALLCARHRLRWVAGHSDIAPGRKVDPGPFFDWPRYLGSVSSTGLQRPFAD
ncbi:1,6-anhydro-N-acetylmuramyl-L-alanine amidase AmpD [Quisquiliibacterium transsilvanicum]|uniref:1,6-anhydro-N-acetylmuramyl-L-alanine amidase AmpD n=1 Tax=Quisquiliibacterium transsilvanicum TaxID=1549638 RepID=A0A7W8HGG2_9BURK|nr:1,6-anhydro-N-acetylmuramyl-L-alanine amidase AmpD [Quisquiliibacterium transsilvanicum]MBB5271637.1 AmpD protein [Quisquiliibacterium transsilvanicum]